MRSSPDVTVTVWQPLPLAVDASATSAPKRPAFEQDRTTTPTLHAFSLSPSAGIPEDVLAAERAAARAAGYADGWARGLADARAATGARMAAEAAAAAAAAAQRDAWQRRAFDAVFDAAAALERQAAPAAADIEEQIVAAAWSIASALVGQVLADAPGRSEAAVRRALALAPADEDVTIAMSEADFAALSGAGSNAADRADDGPAVTALRRERGLRTVTILPDPALADGDAIASCGATTIDARLTTALTRVAEVLAP